MTFSEMIERQRNKSLVKSNINVGDLKMRLGDLSSQCFELFVDTSDDIKDFAEIMQDIMGQIEKAQTILTRVQYGSRGGDVL